MIANVRSASLNRIKKERDVFSFHWLHVDRIGLQRFNIYIYRERDIPNRKVPLIPGTMVPYGTYISDVLESTLF